VREKKKERKKVTGAGLGREVMDFLTLANNARY
jgi:hypothetical protein